LHFDARGANRRFLIEAGIPEGNIETCLMCTYNNPDLLHSFRRDGGAAGHHGLIAAFPA
jgi:copper oxidase (laccase) domain-containing protein